MRTLIERDGLKGVTSNPSIFEKAIGETDEYANALTQFEGLADHRISAIYEHLAITDIRAAADLLHSTMNCGLRGRRRANIHPRCELIHSSSGRDASSSA